MRRRLLDTVQQQILPLLESSPRWQVVLAEPPFQVPSGITVDCHAGKPLAARLATSYPANAAYQYWPSAQVHNSRFPFMGFVLRGAIDWRIGMTASMAKSQEGKCAQIDYALLGLPQGTFFIMPPGVPYSSGQLDHWERAPHEQADFQVFWIRFVPQGVECHFSWATPEGKISDDDYYVSDSQLLFAANALIDELRQDSPPINGSSAINVLRSLLLFIFYRVTRGLEDLKEKRTGRGPGRDDGLQMSAAVGLACEYIQAHLHEKLTLQEIARYSFISPQHLCRIFLAEKRVTVNHYITQCRLDRACALLRGSRLSIHSIAHSVGYSGGAYFCRLFTRHFGCPPLQFRQNHLREYHKKISDAKNSQK